MGTIFLVVRHFADVDHVVGLTVLSFTPEEGDIIQVCVDVEDVTDFELEFNFTIIASPFSGMHFNIKPTIFKLLTFF